MYDIGYWDLGQGYAFGVGTRCPLSFRTNSLRAITDVGLIALSLDFEHFHSRWHYLLRRDITTASSYDTVYFPIGNVLGSLLRLAVYSAMGNEW